MLVQMEYRQYVNSEFPGESGKEREVVKEGAETMQYPRWGLKDSKEASHLDLAMPYKQKQWVSVQISCCLP